MINTVQVMPTRSSELTFYLSLSVCSILFFSLLRDVGHLGTRFLDQCTARWICGNVFSDQQVGEWATW